MADVFTRKCRGCNAILSLRQSCKACADAARARLHAEGVCKTERKPWSEYDDGRLRLTKVELVELKLLQNAVRHVYGDKWADALRGAQKPASTDRPASPIDQRCVPGP